MRGLQRVWQKYEAGRSHPRALMLHGPTGCGKTTLARIFSKSLGVDPDMSPDFDRIDGTLSGGADGVRPLWTLTHYRPLTSPVRIWLFDECHAMSSLAQEVLFGVVEQNDIPWNYFLFCTTELLTSPKLKPALVGRCAHFQVQPLDRDQIEELIWLVCDAEGRVDVITDKLIDDIYRKSYGRPRNALNLLELEL